MKLLEVLNLSHSFGGEPLFKNSEFCLYKGEHIGVVGHNGAGKSTFIKICTKEISPDTGKVQWNPKIKMGYLDQYAEIDLNSTIICFLQSAFRELYELEEKMNGLYSQCGGGNSEDYKLAAKYQSCLEDCDFYSIDIKIDKVLFGLGLNTLGYDRKISEISSGQRAKLILAKLLLEDTDVILLDEPTNFLDVNHVHWLANYIVKSNKTFMIVSHDFDFIGKVSTSICCVDSQLLNRYNCCFSSYLQKKEHLAKECLSKYRKQQAYIQRTEEYVRKNKAGVNCKNARGRLKQLGRIKRMSMEKKSAFKPDFRFRECADFMQSTLELKDLAVGYGYPLLCGLNFELSWGQKILIKGFNGVGKTTLVKTLMNEIKAYAGSFAFSGSVTIGYYDQEEISCVMNENSLQYLAELYPEITRTNLITHLHYCGLTNEQVAQPLNTLSGGELAKVKLGVLTLKSCNFLILDEPTSHLDNLAKEALKESLRSFKGSVILVSHEKKFYNEWIDKIIDVEGCSKTNYRLQNIGYV